MPSRIASIVAAGVFSLTAVVTLTATAPTVAADEIAVRPRPPAGPAYEVHEWGLIAVEDEGLKVVTGTDYLVQRQRPPMTAKKPVLYVHLAKGQPAFDFDLAVGLAVSGNIVEHWPTAAMPEAGNAVSWARVHADPSSCSAQVTWPNEAACRFGGDGLCELAELAHYATSDAACLTYQNTRTDLLFYRAAMQKATLPLDVVADATAGKAKKKTPSPSPQGPVQVTNNGTHALPGMIWRISRKHGAQRTTLVRQVAMPGTTQHVVVAVPTDAVTDADAHRLLIAAATSRGLSPDEAAAFDRAWSMELFGAAPLAGPRTNAKGLSKQDSVKALPAPTKGELATRSTSDEMLVYWLSDADVDALLPLRITPAPTAVHRAMLVMVSL